MRTNETRAGGIVADQASAATRSVNFGEGNVIRMDTCAFGSLSDLREELEAAREGAVPKLIEVSLPDEYAIKLWPDAWA